MLLLFYVTLIKRTILFVFVYVSLIGFLKKTSSSFRSSRQSCYTKKGVLKDFTKFTGKHVYHIRFSNEVASLNSGRGVFL